MDRKSYIVLLASFALLMLWYPMVNKWFPPTPIELQTNRVSNASGEVSGFQTNKVAQLETVASAPGAVDTTDPIAPPLQPVQSAAPEQTLKIESEDAIYTFPSHGGGLKSIELKKYLATSPARTMPPPTNLPGSMPRPPCPLWRFWGDPRWKGTACLY